MLSSVLFATALCVMTFAAALPGDGNVRFLREQTCGTGCVAGLLVMAGIVALGGCFLMCCIFWEAPELISRQEKRASAEKRQREREEAREEARAKEEEIDDDE